MRTTALLLAALMVTQAGCASYSREAALRNVRREEPTLIPTCTTMTPVATCLKQHLLKKFPPSKRAQHHKVVCVTDPSGEGISSHRARALLIDALMKVAIPNLLIVVNCGSLYPPGPGTLPAEHLAPALRVSINVEHDAIDVDGDVGLGLSAYGQRKAALARLGLSKSETIDIMEVTLQPQGDLGIVEDSISVGAAFVGTRANALDVGIGGTIAAFQAELSGSASLVQVTSRDQIFRYLMEQAVVLYISRAFNLTTPCLTLASASRGWRELFDLLTQNDKAQLEDTLLRRVAAAHIPTTAAVVDDGILSECELGWAIAAGVLTRRDIATYTKLPPRLVTTVPDQLRGS